MASEDNTRTVKFAQEEQPVTFVKSSHELTKVLKTLTKASEQAAEFLLNTMNDDRVDMKVRADCAKNLLGLLVAVSKEHSADNLQRLIAQHRMQNPQTKLLVDDSGRAEKPKPPVVDFTQIRTVK